MKTVVIFGGSGFVGNHLTRRLAKNGYRIIIPYQKQANESKLRLFGVTGQIIPIRFKSLDEENIVNILLNSIFTPVVRRRFDNLQSFFDMIIF